MITSYVTRVDRWLQGQPEHAITIALLLAALVLVLVAVYGRPAFKAALLAWVIFP